MDRVEYELAIQEEEARLEVFEAEQEMILEDFYLEDKSFNEFNDNAHCYDSVWA